ncbi:MAG: hypothetical protein IKD66_00550 [Solobacterium sp.]|nr:hypothetical protein [Solobacterium sp.]
MIEQKSYLNLIPDTGPLNVHCSQYDAGIRTLVFGLYKGASLFRIPEGMTAKIRGAKPDGNVFEYSMTVDAEANTVSVTITEQMSVIAGDVICEVVLFNGATDSAANVIGSANFTLIVEPSPIDMGVFSDSDVPAIETLINGGEIGQIMTWVETGVAWTWAARGDMMKAVYDQNDNGIVDNAEKVNGKTVARDVAADEYTNTQIDTELNKKVDKETGKGLSTEDYTTAEKTKLGALPTANELTSTLNGKVDKEAGKGLSTEDYTTADQTKLSDLPTKAELDTALNGKVDKVTGKGLSTKDYTAEDQSKLSGLPTGSELTDALAGKKDKQTPVTSPTASGNALAFIDSVSQDAQGVLTATKKNVTVDSTPTTGSANPVQSGAVATELSNLNQALGNKVDKVAGKGLSTEDYTTAEKTKLGALPDAATLNADLANKQPLLQVTQSISGGYLYNNYYSVS